MHQNRFFDIPTPGLFSAAYLAEVVSVQDPEGLARVQVRLLNFDGVGEQDGPLWARVVVPFAGGNRGAFLLPDVGDEVLVTFVNGDSRWPVICGGLWNGNAKPPETLPGDRVDRWAFVGKAGTRIAIVEASQPIIEFSTPGGVTGTLTDEGGGKIEFIGGGVTVRCEPSGVTVETGGTVKVQASQVEVSAGMVKVSAGMSQFSGIVQCDTLIATNVVGTSYTPGAGNVW